MNNLLERVYSNVFVQTTSDQVAYHPDGLRRRGYVIDSEKQIAIKRELTIACLSVPLTSVVILGATSVIGSWLAMGIGALVMGGTLYFRQRRLLDGLESVPAARFDQPASIAADWHLFKASSADAVSHTTI